MIDPKAKSDDIDFNREGITIHWELIARWILWFGLTVALGFHAKFTREGQTRQDREFHDYRNAQEQRNQQVEELIRKCLEKQEKVRH